MFLETNKHTGKISERPCHTEDWSNGAWKFSFAIIGMKLYIKIENS